MTKSFIVERYPRKHTISEQRCFEVTATPSDGGSTGICFTILYTGSTKGKKGKMTAKIADVTASISFAGLFMLIRVFSDVFFFFVFFFFFFFCVCLFFVLIFATQ